MWPDLQPLIAEYRDSLRRVRRAWERATEPADRQILSSMARDLEWTIEYMRTGWPPQPDERSRSWRKARVVLVDPLVMQAIVQERDRILERAAMHGVDLTVFDRAGSCGLTAAERSALEAVLQDLTAEERDVFMLIAGHRYSEREAARLMGRSQKWVRIRYASAHRKVLERARGITAALISERDSRAGGGGHGPHAARPGRAS